MLNFELLKPNAKIKMNGKKYTVTKCGELGADLEGPRGGVVTLIQNIHNPQQWTAITSGYRCKATPVRSIEAA